MTNRFNQLLNCSQWGTGEKIAFAALISVGLLGVSQASANTYAKLSGIDGESRRVNYEDWISVDGFHSRVYSVQEVPDDGRTVRVASADPFTLTKQLDKASPYLTLGILRGEWFESLRVDHFVGIEREASIRMRGVTVNHLEMENDPETGALSELVGFGYEVIEWHYKRVDQGTGALTHVGTTWNFELNAGGKVNDGGAPPTIVPIDPIQLVPGESRVFTVELEGGYQSDSSQILRVESAGDGLVEIVNISEQGTPWTVEIRASELFRGPELLSLTFSNGVKTNVAQLPVLVAGEQTDFEAYVEGYLSELMLIDPSAGDPLGDPDEDGLRTVMEFLVGTNPGKFTPPGEVFSFEPSVGDDGMEILMRYRLRSNVTELNHYFEGLNSLGDTWKVIGSSAFPAIATERLKSDPSEPYDSMESRIRFGKIDPDSFFIRLRVESSFD